MNNEELIVELTDGNGEKVKVEIVDHFVYEGKDYVIANDLSNETDSYILELKSSENGDELISVDDEELFNKLCDYIDKTNGEEE